MFENAGDLVIIALAVIVAFMIATIIAERRLAETLREERRQENMDSHLREILPATYAAVDHATVRIIEPELRAIA